MDWTHITSLGYDPFHNQLSLPGADTGTAAGLCSCVSPPHTFQANVQRSSGGRHRCLPSQEETREKNYPTQLIAAVPTHYYFVLFVHSFYFAAALYLFFARNKSAKIFPNFSY